MPKTTKTLTPPSRHLVAPADPTGDLAAAEQEANEAAGLAVALEDRIREGDDSVTATELDEAHKLSRFARLRKEAAERKAAKAKADMIATARREHAEQITTTVDSGALAAAPIAAAYAAMRDAVAAFVKTANAYNQAWADTTQAINDYPYRWDDTDPTLEEFDVRSVEYVTGHPQIVAGGHRRYRIRTGEQLGRVVLEAEADISPQYGVQLRPRLRALDDLARQYQPELDGETGKATR